jgi:hypothetical protein
VSRDAACARSVSHSIRKKEGRRRTSSGDFTASASASNCAREAGRLRHVPAPLRIVSAGGSVGSGPTALTSALGSVTSRLEDVYRVQHTGDLDIFCARAEPAYPRRKEGTRAQSLDDGRELARAVEAEGVVDEWERNAVGDAVGDAPGARMRACLLSWT